jgi:hypothetical protein
MPAHLPRTRRAACANCASETKRFTLHYHPVGWKEADGISPTEAEANLLMRGERAIMLAYSRDALDHPEGAFDQGIECIDQILDRPKCWSAAPTFFAQLKADKRVSKLTGGVPDIYPQSGRIGPAHVEHFDRQTAMALALLDELSPTPGKMQSFLIRPRGAVGIAAEGWCPASAMLSLLLKNLFRKELNDNDMLEWEVFRIADESGHLGRRIAAEFEPLHPV